MSCGGADRGTGPVLLCFVVDLFHLGIRETACPFLALMMLWSLGKRKRIMTSTSYVTGMLETEVTRGCLPEGLAF